MSILQLLNVNELNNTFEHSIDFPDLATQTKYFEDRVNTSIALPEDDYVYIRENRTIEVDKNKQELLGVNYLRFNNGNKWWYAFITSKTYINESVTSLEFEIDPIQTFMFDYEIRECYVSREHQDRFNLDKTPKFNLKLENLEMGSDYIKTGEININDSPLDDVRVSACLVVATKPIETGGTLLNGTQGPTNALPDPLKYYIIPIINRPSQAFKVGTSNGLTASALNGDIAGRDDYGSDNLKNQLTKYANIISMSILPYFPFEYTLTKDENNIYTFNASSLAKVTCWYRPVGLLDQSADQRVIFALSSDTLKDFLQYIDIKAMLNIPTPSFTNKTARDIKYETKLYTHPYQYVTLDDDQIEPLVLKPQYFGNLNTRVRFNQAIGVNPIVKYYVDDYKGDTGNDTTLINNTLNDLTVASSKLADYLAQNKASATTGLATSIGIDLVASFARTAIGKSTGNPFAISNAISDIQGIAHRINNENSKRQDLAQGSLNFKAKGNNIYAYVQQYGKNTGVKVRKYSISENFMRFVYNYFYHFGYATNDFKIPDVKSRYYFNYIQIPDVNIKSKIDNEYIQKLKSIYAQGITFWHYRDESTWLGVDDYTYENVEMNLIGV